MIAAALVLLLAAQEAHVDLGPMVGAVSHEEARIWIKSSAKSLFAVEWSERADLAESRRTEPATLEEVSFFCGSVRLPGLKPATRYSYRVILDGAAASVRPYPSFVTAPAPGTRGKVRVGFVSCAGKEGSWAAGGWGDMAAREFDLLLLLGDNHYADSADPAKQRPAYVSHRRPAGWADLTRRTPTLAIWDDHDYGPNNSDGTLKGKEDSLRTFKEVWANPAYGEPDNPGVYFRFSWGDADIFMLDSRYHRTPNKAPEDGKKTMLGPRQLAWLKEGVTSSKAAFKVLACGSEWQTDSQPDCWPSFRRERDDFFKAIEGVSGVILLSGDRHFTAAYQVAGRFLEITSGPLGSKNYPPKEVPPEMVLLQTEGKIHTILELDSSGPAPRATLEVYRAGDGLVETRAFDRDELDGKRKIERKIAPRK